MKEASQQKQEDWATTGKDEETEDLHAPCKGARRLTLADHSSERGYAEMVGGRLTQLCPFRCALNCAQTCAKSNNFELTLQRVASI